MQTYVLRIGELPAGATEYPVTFFDAAAPGVILAAGAFADSLAPPGPGPWLTAEEILVKFREQDSEDPAFPQIGKQLCLLAASGPVRAALTQKLATDARFLLDVQPEALRSLPWELMMDGPRVLFLSERRPWSRGNLDAPPALAPIDKLPLRVLVVVGSSPTDKVVQAEDEVAALVDALRTVEPQVDLWVERRPTATRIRELCLPGSFQPHVFHFIGHGEEGNLLLCLPQAGSSQCVNQPWSTTAIFTDFDEIPTPPRLVILNACRTAAASDRGPLLSVAGAFMLARVPAVISMGADVSGKHSVAFSKELYATLADTSAAPAIDVAVARARGAISRESSPLENYRAWALPTLDLRMPPEQIIRVPVCRVELLKEVQQAAFGKDRRDYVDRRERRSELWYKLNQVAPAYSVLAIAGEPGSGKSAMAHLLVERCLIAGHQARYVNLKNCKELSVLDFLRNIVKGQPVSDHATLLTQPLPDPEFSAFRQLTDGRDPMEMKKQVYREDVFKAFRDGLAALSAQAPVTIVVDQLEGMSDGEFDAQIRPELLNTGPANLKNSVQIILVVSQAQRLTWRLDAPNLLEAPLFDGGEWAALTQECVRRVLAVRGLTLTSDQAESVKLSIQALELTKGVNKPWGPKWLPRVRSRIFEQFGDATTDPADP